MQKTVLNNIAGRVRHYPLTSILILVVWYLSFFTPPQTQLDDVPFIDKWTHIAMYGGTCSVMWIEYLRRHNSLHKLRLFVWAFLAPIVMSGLIELLQAYCTGGRRNGDWLDFVANTVGVTLAAVFGICLYHILKNRRRQLPLVSLCFLSVTALDARGDTFPYPDIPDSLTTTEERAEYLITHYWDNYNFSDSALAQETEVAEQGFVDFIDLLPRFDSLFAVRGVERFTVLLDAGGNDTVRQHFYKLARQYLSDKDSPMRNDWIYITFLLSEAQSPYTDEAEKERLVALAHEIEKNSMGTPAADFSYIDDEGNKTTLYATIADLTVVFFNDPDCERCRETATTIAADPLLKSPKVKVVAVCPDEQIERLYYLPSLPSLYLLDNEKRVVAKDVNVETLHYRLACLQGKQ